VKESWRVSEIPCGMRSTKIEVVGLYEYQQSLVDPLQDAGRSVGRSVIIVITSGRASEPGGLVNLVNLK